MVMRQLAVFQIGINYFWPSGSGFSFLILLFGLGLLCFVLSCSLLGMGLGPFDPAAQPLGGEGDSPASSTPDFCLVLHHSGVSRSGDR